MVTGAGGVKVVAGQLVADDGAKVTAGGLEVLTGGATVVAGGVAVLDGAGSIGTTQPNDIALKVTASSTAYTSTVLSVSTGACCAWVAAPRRAVGA
jgi:hypothetical protein